MKLFFKSKDKIKFEDLTQIPKNVNGTFIFQKRKMSGKKIDLEKRINNVKENKYENYLQLILESLLFSVFKFPYLF